MLNIFCLNMREIHSLLIISNKTTRQLFKVFRIFSYTVATSCRGDSEIYNHSLRYNRTFKSVLFYFQQNNFYLKYLRYFIKCSARNKRVRIIVPAADIKSDKDKQVSKN